MRSLFWECGEGAIAIWGCGSAIAFGDVGMRSLLGFRGAIAVLGMWGCDSEALRRNQKIKLPHLRMARDPLNLSLHAKPVEPPPVPLELYKKSN
ncbi:MAG: hypothetical protein V6D39_09095, partial [Dolichospermum lemmermannii FEM_B0920]